MLPEKNSVSENPDKDQHVVLNAQKTVTAYPPLQFCWLRLLLDLLYIPKWRGSMKNTHRHEPCWVNHPPSNGPSQMIADDWLQQKLSSCQAALYAL
jgi:hypothetical protein